MAAAMKAALLSPVSEQPPGLDGLPPRQVDISASTSRSTMIGEGGLEDDDDDDTDADEEGLLWDAQTALITHQHDSAIQLYTTAAIPPHKSSRACLALGNLLTRGSGIKTVATSPTDQTKSFDFTPALQDPVSPPTTPLESPSIITRLTGYFGWPAPSVPPPQEPELKPMPRRLLGDSWSIPKEGKRAQRDVQGMGVAAGWLLLGLAWMIEQDKALGRNSAETSEQSVPAPNHKREDSSVIVFSAKGKGKEISNPGARSTARETSGLFSDSQNGSSTYLMSSSGSGSETAPTSQTSSDSSEQQKRAVASVEKHQLIYDLLRPLLHLYRHGQIQAHDPIFLPPIPQADLPPVLKGSGDLAKRRNAYTLGGVIARVILDKLPATEAVPSDGAEAKSRRLIRAINIMSSYVLGMTAPNPEKAGHFANIIDIGHCNLTGADDLIVPAAQRLESLTSKSRSASAFVAQPITRNRRSGHGHRRILSTRSEYPARLPRNSSLASFTSSFAAGIQPSPIRSATSSTSLVSDLHPVRSGSEVDALKSLQRLNKPSSLSLRYRDDSTEDGTIDTPATSIHAELSSPAIPLLSEPEPLDQGTIRPIKPKLRHTRSSPVLYAHQPLTRTVAESTSSSAFLTPEQANIAPIDRALAQAELASALTKQVKCSVCGAEGINFPECRKCGLQFCSRDCRIGEQGAGDGKRHHCGLFEERTKILSAVDIHAVPSTPSITVH